MLAIWGTGLLANRVITEKQVMPDKIITSSGGGVYQGKPVESPDAIDNSIERLIIASMFYPEIMETILKIKFPLDRVEIFAESYVGLPLVSISPHEVAINLPEYKKNIFGEK